METRHKIKKEEEKNCHKIVIFLKSKRLLETEAIHSCKKQKNIICDLCNRKKLEKIYNKIRNKLVDRYTAYKPILFKAWNKMQTMCVLNFYFRPPTAYKLYKLHLSIVLQFVNLSVPTLSAPIKI